METIVPYAIWAALILAGLGVLSMGVFSLRNLAYGKVEPLSIAILIIPGVILGILGVVMDTWAQAAMTTLLVMFGLTLLGLLASGIRSLFT
ncbi:MAG: hypothetical protein GVY35_03595 [Bacteroidetes bacterium]|jgi:hypothetical protein|nr:hypothetical protein [Bacteroidota bacterium]